jgi:hypothetical protein
VFDWGTTFKPAGGVYAVTRATPKSEGGNSHHVLYLGQTSDISERFEAHHKVDCFRQNGANCLGVFIQENEDTRLAAERDLIASYNPKCNG